MPRRIGTAESPPVRGRSPEVATATVVGGVVVPCKTSVVGTAVLVDVLTVVPPKVVTVG
jgi:hypothetical protein